MIHIPNGGAIPLTSVELIPVAAFRREVIDATLDGGRFVSLASWRLASGVRLLAVVARSSGALELAMTEVSGTYEALTPDCPQARAFENELWENTGVVPAGHPWMKKVRFPAGGVGLVEFYRVEGLEVHEVAVGPVHAGVIEPGHFRFQCHGERVMHLEISLGYQHRGVERALLGGPDLRTLHYMETLAGDTTVGHASAYAALVESLAGAPPPPRAETLRGIALELERLANHTGDLGALAGDVAYAPTAAFCGRLRGEFLNVTALLCGNRFGRGMIRPGGVGFDIDDERARRARDLVTGAFRDVSGAVGLLWNTPSVMGRFEGTGTISRETCQALGLVGPAARACGIERDVRCDFPSGVYRFRQIPVSTWTTGDVFARAYVRWLEIQRSVEFVLDGLTAPPEGGTRRPVGALATDSVAVSLVEGWRGEICHVAITGGDGRFIAYKVVDPSFHNWIGLAMALREQEISDFPLCNKSFNLSYCGHDL